MEQEAEAICLSCRGSSPAAATGTPPGTGISGRPGVTTAALLGGTPHSGLQKAQTYVTQVLSDRLTLRVDVASGNLLLQASDLVMRGTGLDLAIGRAYNSLGANWPIPDATPPPPAPGQPPTETFGNRWAMAPSVDASVQDDGAGNKLFYGPTGEILYFTASGGAFTSPAGSDATLVQNVGGDFTLTFHKSSAVMAFDSAGYLTSQTDRNGNHISLTYTGGTPKQPASIADTQGRSVSFTYSPTHLLTAIADPSGRTVQYGYNASSFLTTITDAANKQTVYGYDTSGLLNQITDPDGNITKVAYDTSLRATSITRVTNVGAGTGPTTIFVYNIIGTTAVTDANSHATTYTYDTKERVTQATDALNHTRKATYNSDNNVLTTTDAITPTDNVTTYTYGANGGESLTKAQLPTGASGTLAYTDAGHPYLPSSQTDAQGNQITYAYNTPGNRLSTTNQLPSNNVTSATYNTNGTVATTTDALGHMTNYAYTYASGKLTTVVITPPTVAPNPLGAVTLNIDGLGRVASRVDGKGQTETFTHDNLDRITRITYNGDTACASRPTCTDYGHDDDGNLTSLVDSTGTTAFTYDKQNTH